MNALPSLREFVLAVLAAGGGGALVAWGIFAKFSDRWLESRFTKHLEEFRHEKTREIEQLRHQIASVFSRISKVHEKEFEVLPAAWQKLHQAYGLVFRVGSAFQQYPQLDQMTQPQFEEFVATCRLPQFRKEELRIATERNDYYQRWIFWSDFAEARTAHTEFRNYFVLNRLFMTSDIHARFSEIDRLMSSVLIAAEINKQTPDMTLRRNLSEDLARIEPLLPVLESSIQERLRYSEA